MKYYKVTISKDHDIIEISVAANNYSEAIRKIKEKYPEDVTIKSLKMIKKEIYDNELNQLS